MGLSKLLKKAKKAVKKVAKNVVKPTASLLKAVAKPIAKVPVIGKAASLAANTNALLVSGKPKAAIKLAVKKGPKAMATYAAGAVAQGALSTGFLAPVGDFISNVQGIAGQAGDLLGQVGGFADALGFGDDDGPSGGAPLSLPDSFMDGADRDPEDKPSMMPLVVAGAAVVVLLVVLKKGRS